MREHHRSCTVSAPPEVVWDLLADYRATLALASNEATARLRAGRPGEVGAVYDARVNWEGLESSFPVKLVAAERPRSLSFESHASGSRGSLRYELEPVEDGTKVVLAYALELARPTRPLEPFAWALYSRLADRLVRKLHTHHFSDVP
jgi:carbon monoxide dehydrogenase subunit G